MNITEALKIANLIPSDVEVLTDEQKQATTLVAEQRNKNAAALQYLAQTDWYVIRSQESGVVVPVDVAAQRQAARDSVIAC
jgi:hypothetical protein